MQNPAKGPRVALSGLLLTITIAVIALAGPRIATAQSVSGNVYGIVVDEQGKPLPGVAVTLTGVGAPLAATTTAGGEFRFLNLSLGEYKVTAVLTGYSTAERADVIVASRQNAEIRLTMKIAAQSESVVVTGAPLLDTRKANVGVNVTQRELEAIPTARDPWVIARSVPGVQSDRVNVGGSESGQQSYLTSKGAPPAQAEWIMEGIVFQSMSSAAAVGTSPLYYDFDALQEIHVSTGGTDPSTQTPGVQVNLVTKRGTNVVHGSARYFTAQDSWEATNTPEELRLQLAASGAGSSVVGNSINNTEDYGGELGGALLADHLWLWGAYGRNQIDLFTTGGLTDNTTLQTYNAKLNAQLLQSNSANFYFYRGDKVKLGRDAGTTRPQETSFDQSGPANVFKIEDSHVFDGNLFATVMGSHKNFSWRLVPEGSGQMRQDSTQVFHNTYYTALYDWPDSQVDANVSYFIRTGQLSHELKLGGLYRFIKTQSRQLFEGNVVACNTNANWCGNQTVPAAVLNRDFAVNTNEYQYSGFVSDTITLPRLTVNIGLRYDYQSGVNNQLVVDGSRATDLVPPGTVLPPSLNAPPEDPGFRWKNWQPRIGATYAAGKDQKTLIRASYASYANQLYSGLIAPYSVAPPTALAGGAGVVYPWNDLNNNNHVDPGELDTSRILRYYGFDPADPTSTASINGVDPSYGSVKTNEIAVGVERELLPTLAVALGGTYRKMTNFDLSTGFGLTQADYILSTTNYRENGRSANPLCPDVGYACGALPDGTHYNVPVYRVAPGVPLSPGQYTTNNPGYDQTYYGVDFQATKAYANNWMARLTAAYGDWRQHYSSDGFVDPTNVAVLNGGLVVAQSLGSGDKTRVYVNGTWQVDVSAMYNLPLGFSVAGNFYARQGYPLAYFQNVIANPDTAVSYDRSKVIIVAPYENYRLGTVSNLDLGLAYSLTLSGVEIQLLADVFNVMNANTVLQRQSQLGLSGPNGTNSIREIQSPRILRLGTRVSF